MRPPVAGSSFFASFRSRLIGCVEQCPSFRQRKKKTGHLKLGSILGEFFRGILRKNPRLHKLLVSLGSGDVPEDEQNEARIELEDLVLPIRQKLSKILLCTHSGPVNNDECDTDIRAELLRRWATVARDPGVGVCNRLTRGANAGLSADPEGIDGIFPLADTELEEFEADECISTQSAESLDNDSMERCVFLFSCGHIVLLVFQLD